jgi:organic hydroperoxide reductase OsmC/OhrA
VSLGASVVEVEGQLQIGSGRAADRAAGPLTAGCCCAGSDLARIGLKEGEIVAGKHHFASHLVWTGGAQGPTSSSEAYSRDYRAQVEGKPPLDGSAHPAFRGDASRYNPEDLLVLSLSACHMLSYLHLCASAGIEVVAYEDRASGTMAIKDRKMRFVDVLLEPKVTIAKGDRENALALHEAAHGACFIASSVNFPVRHEAVIEQQG